MSAIVETRDAGGDFLRARVLLDTCATAHFVTEPFAKQLNLPTRICSISINAINGMQTVSKGSVDITLRSICNKFQMTLTFLIVPKITDFAPDEVFPRELIKIPANIRLADPDFHLPRPVDILIGAGTTLSLLSIGQIKLTQNDCDFVLQKTQLGWVIVGDLISYHEYPSVSCNLNNLLDKQLENFWNIEDANYFSEKTLDEDACETHYIKNTTRNEDGRYTVRLPFRHDKPNIGNSRSTALKRFHTLLKKLNSNPDLNREYQKVMQEYIDLGHMSVINDESDDGYYMPHHCVIKTSSDTTKVRVVFDASASSSTGISLNNTLYVGRTMQDTLFENLLRFRMHVYVLIADIAKMYRQVLIHPDHRRYQRIFWKLDNIIRVFQLNTVTFGVAAAAFLAIRTIIQLARDECKDFPFATKILERDLYVDDLLTGADSLDEILKIRDEIIELLRRGGFDIRQWASNHQHALDNIDEKILNLDCAVKENIISKTLGIIWNSQHDYFIYTVNQITINDKITKRNIISNIAKIFDPLGLLGPVILNAKVILQDCWKSKIDWDESVPQELHCKWKMFARQLELIRDLSINRRLLIDNYKHIEIHGFCDASRVGYGACIYIRSTDNYGRTLVRLACSKSRIAPLKEITIPRLELCGAQILARLYKQSQKAFIFPINRIIFWSDSTIVLHWLKKSPALLKTFEANRVNEIQTLTVNIDWRHIRTEHNPADALSRGQLPSEFLRNKTWFEGPSWLRLPENSWPITLDIAITELPGLKKSLVY